MHNVTASQVPKSVAKTTATELMNCYVDEFQK
jgi:hypothetical protein